MMVHLYSYSEQLKDLTTHLSCLTDVIKIECDWLTEITSSDILATAAGMRAVNDTLAAARDELNRFGAIMKEKKDNGY